MAIIKCPECEEKISTTAKQCVHCGAKITICPECEAAFARDVSSCPECGFVINSANEYDGYDESDPKKTAEEKPERKETLTERIQNWISENPVRMFAWGGVIPMATVLKWISNILVAFAAERISSHNDLLELATNFGLIKWILIIAAVVRCCRSLILVYSNHFAYSSFGSWALNRKIDLVPLVTNDLTQDMRKLVPEEIKKNRPFWRLGIRALFYNSDEGTKNKNALKAWLGCVLSIISIALFTYFLIINVPIVFIGWKIVTDNQIGYIFENIQNLWSMVAAVVIKIVQSSFLSVSLVCDQSELEWVKKMMPQLEHNYEEHIFWGKN